MKTLFIDETGDHDLIKIDQNYPIFALCGVIFDQKDIKSCDQKIDKFKSYFFQNKENHILHSSDIKRRRNGMQISDLCANPIARYYLKKESKKDIEILK